MACKDSLENLLMIKSITIKGVTSFAVDEAVRIDINQKKVCLFYGLNGTGKTTIANFLQNQAGSDFGSCSVEFVHGNNPELLVYNQQFIEDNFLESSSQPGVFTLSKGNKEAEQAIDNAKREIKRIDKDNVCITEEIQKIEAQKIEKTDQIKEKVWKAKSRYERTSLDYCLVRLKGSREQFLEKVRQTSCEEIDVSPDDLMQEAKELLDQETMEKVLIDGVSLDLSMIENSPLFQEVIVGSGESYLSQLIKRLGNSDWVKQGAEFLRTEQEKCPFCQQNLPVNFEDEIRTLFNEAYQDKLDELKKIHQQYKDEIERVGNILSGSSFQDDYVTGDSEFVGMKEKLQSLLKANLAKIAEKCTSPSTKITLQGTDELITQLNEMILAIRSRIGTYNEKIKNRNVHLNALKDKFWKLVRAQYQDVLLNFENDLMELESRINAKNNELESVKTEIRKNRETISENRKKITNIELSIETITRQLSMLGLEGFELVKETGDSSFYRLKRGSDDYDIYKSLSEGEKTLITFLYFIELCQGSLNSETPVDPANRIIVIDDPISSLSHNYVYDVASIIHYKIIEAGYRQILLLTHSLFFFHEILRLKNAGKDCPTGYKLFRITKNKYSQVKQMARGDIQNDYQSYWQVIRDAREGAASNIILPNMMRNILEYYFAFIHQQDNLKAALEKLGTEDSEFKPLYRYINRQSHSDAINLTDFGEIDPEHFLDKFRKVFEETGFEDHYDKMMGVEDEQQP